MVDVGHPRLKPLAAHVFVDDLETPILRDDDAHHVLRVLRLRDGEALSVSDGAGRWRTCAVSGSAIEATSAISSVDPPTPVVTVGFALTKGDKPELTVQKLTEIGVDRIVPIQAERSVVRWDDAKARRNVERWRDVARAAAMQSRRVWLPEVADVVTAGHVRGAAFAHPGGDALTLANPTLLIGPEGGWTDGEIAGSPCVDLGATTLRAETAAIAAGVLLVAFRDGRASPTDMSISPGS